MKRTFRNPAKSRMLLYKTGQPASEWSLELPSLVTAVLLYPCGGVSAVASGCPRVLVFMPWPLHDRSLLSLLTV